MCFVYKFPHVRYCYIILIFYLIISLTMLFLEWNVGHTVYNNVRFSWHINDIRILWYIIGRDDINSTAAHICGQQVHYRSTLTPEEKKTRPLERIKRGWILFSPDYLMTKYIISHLGIRKDCPFVGIIAYYVLIMDILG